MATYWYKALGAEGGSSEGTIVATTRREALQRLIDSGQNPLELREQAESDGHTPRLFRLGRRAIRLATLTRQLATLSASGVPVVKGLNVLIAQHKDPEGKRLLTEAREAVQSGNTFAEALAQHPQVFPKLMTSMVRVGEISGTLDEQLLELSELYEREEALKGEVLSAVAYPVLVLIAGVVSAIVLVAFFIPKLEAMFEGAGQSLPAPTRALLAISHFVTGHPILLLGALLAAVLGLGAALRQPDVRLAVDAWKLRVPWVGTLVRNLSIARLARLLGTLTHGGISIVDALDIVEPAIANQAVAATLHSIAGRVRTGESLAALMGENEVFPPLSVQMVAVGEETGLLDQMLLRVADAYDRETTAAAKVMTSLLAPALILVVAGLVGFILISVLLPIFQLSTVMR
ncbi:MAG: type II secretion system F family protein [Candidatus Hydrogenedentes bacterium]|nr:type II secretion system F family protein [Candidatus Hydrogenedentota bacterium]